MNITSDNLLKCSICGATNYKNLTRHIVGYHRMTTDQYRDMYTDDKIYLDDLVKGFSKGGYNANKVMKDSGFDYSMTI